MRERPYVCKRDGVWLYIKPVFGFRNEPDIIPFDTYEQLLDAVYNGPGQSCGRDANFTIEGKEPDGISTTPIWTPLTPTDYT